MQKFWKWLFWTGLLGLVGLNIAPYLMAKRAAERIDINIVELFHADGRPVEKTNTSYLGKLARNKLDEIFNLDLEAQEKKESYVLQIELRNYNQNALTLADSTYQIWTGDVLLGKGEYRPKIPVTIPSDGLGDLYLPLTFEGSFEKVIETLREFGQVRIEGNAGFLVSKGLRMETAVNMDLELGPLLK